MTEYGESFACFGSTCAVRVLDDHAAVARCRDQLLEWHARFTRFDGDSELSRLNRDPRGEIVVSRTMARLAEAVLAARAATGGLVDGTLAVEIEAAGYRGQLGAPVPLQLALRLAPARRPARPRAGAAKLEVEGLVLRRSPGVALDGGGLAKGLFADLLADRLDGTYAVDCAGDLRLGGAAREVHVASPFGGGALHTFELADVGVATSGIGRRSWLGADGRPRHHLLDPATGEPAFTGVVQVTAIAPTALEAEWRAKAAVLAGPRSAASWLAHGGLIVLDDGDHAVVDAADWARPTAAPTPS